MTTTMTAPSQRLSPDWDQYRAEIAGLLAEAGLPTLAQRVADREAVEHEIEGGLRVALLHRRIPYVPPGRCPQAGLVCCLFPVKFPSLAICHSPLPWSRQLAVFCAKPALVANQMLAGRTGFVFSKEQGGVSALVSYRLVPSTTIRVDRHAYAGIRDPHQDGRVLKFERGKPDVRPSDLVGNVREDAEEGRHEALWVFQSERPRRPW